jgi:hypothetical protein
MLTPTSTGHQTNFFGIDLLLQLDPRCNGQVKPDTFLDSLSIKIPLILQRGLIA